MPTVARAAAAAWHALSASRGSAARSAPPRGPDAALMRQRVQARLLWPIEHEYLENVQTDRPARRPARMRQPCRRCAQLPAVATHV